jgi:hypothetical protein
MSIPLAVNDIVKVSLWCSNAEQASVNRFFFQVTATAGSVPSDTTMSNELDTGFFSTAVPPILNNLSRYNGVEVQIRRGAVLFASANATAGAAAGTGGTVALPRQVAGITHWSTIFAGQQFRGRSYWPFPSLTADVGDGTPTNAYIALISTISAGLLNFTTVGTGGNTATVQMVMVHGPNKAGITPPPSLLVSATEEGKWATQRRRGSFGRPNVSPI